MKTEQLESEGRIQAECVTWFKNNFRHLRKLLYMVHNDGRKNLVQATTDTARGLTAGVLDLNLDIPSYPYHGLRIEMKVPGKGPDPDQKEMIALLRHTGYRVEVIDNFGDFQKLILEYVPEQFKNPESFKALKPL